MEYILAPVFILIASVAVLLGNHGQRVEQYAAAASVKQLTHQRVDNKGEFQCANAYPAPDLATESPVISFYGRPQTDLAAGDQQQDRMGAGWPSQLYDTVHPSAHRGTGWSVTDRRPLPPALFKRPASKMNTRFADLHGPPLPTGNPHGNQVWINERARQQVATDRKINSGRGALDYYNLFPDAIATGGGGDPNESTWYGRTFTSYHTGNKRTMPTHATQRREIVDNRTRNADKAYAKPGGMLGQEQSRLGLIATNKNADIYERTWRPMLPSKNVAAGLPAGPEEVVLRGSCTQELANGLPMVGPPGNTHGERPWYRGQKFVADNVRRQNVNIGFTPSHGHKYTKGDWSVIDNTTSRPTNRQYTQFASRPSNPGYIGGLEQIGDVMQECRNTPSGVKYTSRQEWVDYNQSRFLTPDKPEVLRMQYNQDYGYMGDRRKMPEIELDVDSAILEPYRNNPFTQPLNPFDRYNNHGDEYTSCN